MALLEIFDPKAPPRPIGIDLGTTNSLVARVRDGRPVIIQDCNGNALLPSVVHYDERGGTIVNMSWDHVATGMAGDDPQLFAAVKGGVLAFSKSLARALAPDVRVNVLCPGWIETAFGKQADPEFHRSVARDTPLGRWGRPEDVARAALYLASPEAAFVTGQALRVNGGVVM